MTILADHLFAALGRYGSSPALEGDGLMVSHGDLRQRAEMRARELTGHGVGPSQPHLVMVDNRPQDVVELLAVYRTGAVAVPVHRATPPERVAALKATLARGAGVDPGILDGASTIVFTSGSTGKPKAVVLAADRQARKLATIRSETDWRDGRRTALALQLTFSFGQWVAWLTLMTGGTLVFPRRLSPSDVADLVTAIPIDHLPAVPTLLRALLADPRLAKRPDLAFTVMAGGEVLPAGLGTKIGRAWPAVAIGDIYGSTETGTCDFFVDPLDYATAAGTLGRPGRDIEVGVAESGELRIRSPYAMRGYLGDPALTAAAFDGDGFFRTGDLVRRRSDDRLELVGRATDLINRGGLKVAPLEVEAVLAAHPEVAAALVTGVSDADTGEAVVAVVAPTVGRRPVPEDLLAWAGERLERYKVPRTLRVVDTLPTGATGKADRRAVAALFADGCPQ